MPVINKELYDALIEAKVSDEKATAAAKSDTSAKDDIATVNVKMAAIEAHLANHDKMLWAILLGVIGLIIKSLLT
jgi:hypothetical protein